LAAEAGLLDPKDLAVDSVRIRAEASPKSIRTLARSEERLAELEAVDLETLDVTARQKHDEKVAKHTAAVERCHAEGRTSHSVTNETAGLMKFPSGATLPGHRVTVVAAGMRLRFVLAVLIGSAPTDSPLLEPAIRQTQEVLRRAGITENLQVVGDAGFLAPEDLKFAMEEREEVDILLNDPPIPRRGKSKRAGGFFSRAEFDVLEDGTVFCPAHKAMHGPLRSGVGKVRWRGVGCGACPLKPQCTSGDVREVQIDLERDRLHRAMRARMEQPGAKERYGRRMATVEPVFSYIEDAMGYHRASSRYAPTVRAEILLKVLAYNLYRLFFCPSNQVAIVEGFMDGSRMVAKSVTVWEARDVVAAWG
jgi:transposase